MENGQKDMGPLVDAIAEGKTSLKCSAGNRVTQLCINKNCKAFAGFCIDEDCQTCCQSHQVCDSVRTLATAKLLQACFRNQKYFIEHFAQIQQKIIQSIKNSSKNFEKQITMSLLTGKHQNIIEALYLNQNKTSFGSQQSFAFKNWLLEAAAKTESKGKQLLTCFQQECNKLVNSFKTIQQKLVNNYIDICSGLVEFNCFLQNDSMISEIVQPIVTVEDRSIVEQTVRIQQVQLQKKQLEKINQQLTAEVKRLSQDKQKINVKVQKLQKELLYNIALLKTKQHQTTRLQLFRNSSLQVYFQLDSLIIRSVDSQAFYYLYQALDYPKSMTLLFRASQHQYSAEKLWKVWGSKKQTLTLIHTQQNYIVACYLSVSTPSGSNFSTVYSKDEKKKSFILSISQRFKMKLRDRQKACKQIIYNTGPMFGEDDVKISNQCNLNRNSHFNIPTSYELPQNTQIKNFDKLKCNFKVWQYEMFQIQHF